MYMYVHLCVHFVSCHLARRAAAEMGKWRIAQVLEYITKSAFLLQTIKSAVCLSAVNYRPFTLDPLIRWSRWKEREDERGTWRRSSGAEVVEDVLSTVLQRCFRMSSRTNKYIEEMQSNDKHCKISNFEHFLWCKTSRKLEKSARFWMITVKRIMKENKI